MKNLKKRIKEYQHVFNMYLYEDSYLHSWDWDERFPWPKWWTITLPDIIKSRELRDRYFFYSGPSKDIIVKIFQAVYKFLVKFL